MWVILYKVDFEIDKKEAASVRFRISFCSQTLFCTYSCISVSCFETLWVFINKWFMNTKGNKRITYLPWRSWSLFLKWNTILLTNNHLRSVIDSSYLIKVLQNCCWLLIVKRIIYIDRRDRTFWSTRAVFDNPICKLFLCDFPFCDTINQFNNLRIQQTFKQGSYFLNCKVKLKFDTRIW